MTLSQQELESRLWAAANSLRGPVDPSDFKAYIFPLLFYKRVTDAWDDERARAVADFGADVTSDVEADYHRFQLPEGCHYGQEVSLTTAAIARMNLFLHDVEDVVIRRGDTLRDPKFLDERGRLQRFDVVITNPPFSLKNWGVEVWSHDPWGRAACGVPPGSNGDFAWVQHMLASMTPGTGRVGVVMPHGVLFRGGAEGTIRECLLRGDRLDAVVGLAPNLFYSTSIPASLLIFRATKASERRGHVLFVDGSKRFAKGRNQNNMRPDDVDALVAAYRSGADPDGEGGAEVRLVPLTEIEANGWDLNIGRYIKGAAAEVIDVETALADLADAQSALHEAEERLAERLAEAGYA